MSKDKKNNKKNADKKTISKFSKIKRLLTKLSSFERTLLLDEYCSSCGKKEKKCKCDD